MHAPKRITWIISLILGVLSIVGYFVAIPFVSLHLFWFMTAAWVVLLVGVFIKGL